MPRLNEETIRRQKSTHLQATPRPCLCLKIKVLRAKNVTLGWLHDAFDTPDPYVTLTIPHSAEVYAKTKRIKDDKNPVWNETFTFHLENKAKDTEDLLEIALWDSDTFNQDDKIGKSVFLSLKDLPLEDTARKTFTFNKSQVEVQFDAHYEKEAYHLRYGEELCDDELAFLEKRKPIVLEAMRKLLGERAPRNLDEVPNIAVLGSGGGYRATTCFTAACRALDEMQLMDCVTYLTALSGSAWSLSLMYAQIKEDKLCPKFTQSHIRDHLDTSPMSLFTPRKIKRYTDDVKAKFKNGQPVSFTDVYGHIVGTHLMGDAKDKHKLSDQRDNVKGGLNPLPIYTALNSKKDVSAEMVSEWVEFTPYEVGMEKYGTFMNTKLFGSQFFCGKLIKEYTEPPLCYLQGIWGSFFAILIQRVLEEKQHLTDLKDDVMKQISDIRKSVSDDVRSLLRRNRASVVSSDIEEEELGVKSDANETAEQVVKTEDEAPDYDDDDVFETDIKNESDIINESTLTEKKKKNQIDSRDAVGKTADNKKRPKTAAEQKATGIKALEYVMEKVPYLKTRRGRAGLVHNFLRGVGLKPYQEPKEEESQTCADHITHNFEQENMKKKKIELIDAGLQFNSPYPPILRPERDVELILSFDFSARDKDSVPPFKNLKLAETWAKNHGVPFPPINDKEQEELKECYVFKDPTDDTCPIVMHFVLINKTFKKFKKPCIPRTTLAEVKEGSFAVFDDPSKCYSTFNLHYTHSKFDNLSKLVEFNTALNEDLIKDNIVECVQRRRAAKS